MEVAGWSISCIKSPPPLLSRLSVTRLNDDTDPSIAQRRVFREVICFIFVNADVTPPLFRSLVTRTTLLTQIAELTALRHQTVALWSASE